nr:hypothetical protein [Tanacetum cinerariifolium]
MKQNINKSKSWKIEEIKYRLNITCWNCNQKDHLQNQCSKLVASRDKEVNQAARDSDDTLDVRYISGLKRRLISVGQLDEEGYHRLGDMSMIGMSMLASKGNVPDVRKVDIYFCKPSVGKQKNLSFIMSVKTRKLQRAESMGLGAEAPKILWADSVSTTYLIYRIPYVPIGLRIHEEDWRGKDTSLTHLKVFYCDSFVKVKDVCGESMKCTFIGSDLDEVRYIFRDTKSHQVIRSRDITFVDLIYEARFATNSISLMKPIQKSQVVLVDIPENDNIVTEHGLSSEITQSPDGESSKEGGSETPQVRISTRESRAPVRYSPSANYLLLIENGKLESYSVALSSKESVQWKKAINKKMVQLEKNQTCFLVRLLAGKKASQRLWMFKVKEEQNSSERYKAPLSIVAPGAFLCGSLE